MIGVGPERNEEGIFRMLEGNTKMFLPVIF
uniref:Uncharacterized protein n=1 Tax=Anguilla anguilla TaxID=7936 RepID=A0A0E9SIF1_ANGAN